MWRLTHCTPGWSAALLHPVENEGGIARGCRLINLDERACGQGCVGRLSPGYCNCGNGLFADSALAKTLSQRPSMSGETSIAISRCWNMLNDPSDASGISARDGCCVSAL